uniref:Fimbrial-type adhesion domain-containing protein n=1 Tax=Serratia marcescens TaxID=615 RepID=A0A1C3HFT0_SERMA|nr:Uncharacterised protein [Serratia marcescens]
MKQRFTASALLCAAMACPFAWAEKTADMQFRGTLIAPPPCTLNDDGIIDVDFGDRVGINKVDGVNYRQTIGYRIRCEPGIGKWDMLLSLTGTAATFDEAAVQTNRRSLGIRIYQNAQPFKVGSALPVDPAKPPVLEAVPIGKPGEALTEGAFEAAATLRADYQ